MSASIRDQGIIVPIVIWFWELKWWLLDGRNRVLCAKAVSYRFKPTDFKVFVGDLAAAAAFVEAVNGHRRHLSLGAMRCSRSAALRFGISSTSMS